MLKNGRFFWIASRHYFGDNFVSFWALFGEPWGVKSTKKRVRKNRPKNDVAQGGGLMQALQVMA